MYLSLFSTKQEEAGGDNRQVKSRQAGKLASRHTIDTHLTPWSLVEGSSSLLYFTLLSFFVDYCTVCYFRGKLDLSSRAGY